MAVSQTRERDVEHSIHSGGRRRRSASARSCAISLQSVRGAPSAPIFPWGTLIINVTGSFLIGTFTALFATRWNLPQAARIFLTVGICGGYTTFSTFSLDACVSDRARSTVASAAYGDCIGGAVRGRADRRHAGR